MTISDIVNKAINDSNNKIPNLVRTIAYASQEAYVNAMNDIYKQVGTGKVDYNTALSKTINELAKTGITIKSETSDRKDRIEVAVKRGLFGSLHRTANDIAEKVGEEIDYNCVSIGHSSTCRPSHNVIDDVVMSKREFEKYKYLTEEYGCNHIVNYDWLKEFEGIDDKIEYGIEHMSDSECEKNYEIQQQARYYERIIRTKKSAIECGDTSDKIKKELQLAQIKYRTFRNNNNLKMSSHRLLIPRKDNKTIYEDITKHWLKEVNSSSYKVIDRNYFEYNSHKYYVDGKNVVLDYSMHEKEVAEWLQKTFDEEIYMIPRINYPEGIKTPDYIFKDEKWDLKTIIGNSNQAFYHAVRKKKQQSNNFIFEISNSKLSIEDAKKQINILYSRTDVPFINKIIVKKDNDFLVFKKRM